MRFQKLRPDAKVPTYGSQDAAGADLYACTAEAVTIAPGEAAKFPIGIAVEIPKGYVGLIFARSSMGMKRGLVPANMVGVIDADYRGEICVFLRNQSNDPQTVEPYERVAQMAIMPVMQVEYVEAEDLGETDRGTGGFGSTGRF